MKSTVSLTSALLAGTALSQDLYPGLSTANHTCVVQPKFLSCPAQNPSSVDTCCTETFGGLVLQTQFWSTYTGLESQGQLLPKDTWTLHGLWPDFCNGSYTQYCDLNRQYDPMPSPNVTNFPVNGTVVPAYKGPSISTFIEAAERYDLLDWMNTYWINQGAPNSDFWAHEFSKHATCYSTFQIPCYGPNYTEHEDVIQFFETAIAYYQRYPTFTWLSKAGITPSNSTQVTLSDLQAPLTAASGALPYIGCRGPKYNETDAGKGSSDNGRTIISEVWYYNHVLGRPQEGITYPVNASSVGSASNCAKAKGGLWYYQQTNSSVRGSGGY